MRSNKSQIFGNLKMNKLHMMSAQPMVEYSLSNSYIQVKCRKCSLRKSMVLCGKCVGFVTTI